MFLLSLSVRILYINKEENSAINPLVSQVFAHLYVTICLFPALEVRPLIIILFCGSAFSYPLKEILVVFWDRGNVCFFNVGANRMKSGFVSAI